MSARLSMAALAALFLLLGCARPVMVSELQEPGLDVIHERFDEIVVAAHEDTERQWFSGWTGNTIVNMEPEENLGLCYQWQEWVYAGIKPTAEEVGWVATGVAINNKTQWEHHAVVVYDPARIDESELLDAGKTDPVYVLDAWRHGESEVYRMKDWLGIPFIVFEPAFIEKVPFTLPRPPPGRSYMVLPDVPYETQPIEFEPIPPFEAPVENALDGAPDS